MVKYELLRIDIGNDAPMGQILTLMSQGWEMLDNRNVYDRAGVHSHAVFVRPLPTLRKRIGKFFRRMFK